MLTKPTTSPRIEDAARRFAPPVQRFLSWWIGELRGVVPSTLTTWLLGRRAINVFASESGDLSVSGRSLLDDPAACRALLRGRSVDLMLPEGRAIVRTIRLPREARANLDEILALELDRHTPFRADQALFSYAIEPSPRADQVAASVIVVPLGIARNAIAALSRVGARPSRILVSGRPGRPLPLRQVGLRSSRYAYWPETALACVSVATILASSLIAVDRERVRWARLSDEVATAQRASREAATIRADVERLDTRDRALRQRDLAPSMLSLLADLTRLLPPHTYLQEITLTRRTVTIIGQSQAASDLIEILESSPLFRNARFRAAIVPSPARGRERFDITMDIEESI